MALILPGGNLVKTGRGRYFNPGNPIGINWDNPITRKLCFAWCFGSPIAIDFVGVHRATDSSGQNISRRTRSGTAGSFGTGAGKNWAIGYTPLIGSGDITLACLANPANELNSRFLTGQWQSGSTQVHLVANRNASNVDTAGVATFYMFNGSFEGVTASGVVDGNYHSFMGTRQGTAHTLYMDGASKATATATAQNVSNSSQLAYVSGTPGLFGANCNVDVVAWWNRALQPYEAIEFWNDPFGIFLYPEDAIWNFMIDEAAAPPPAVSYQTAVTVVCG